MVIFETITAVCYVTAWLSNFFIFTYCMNRINKQLMMYFVKYIYWFAGYLSVPKNTNETDLLLNFA